MFQFHTGSITRRAGARSSDADTNMFQFHTGSITRRNTQDLHKCSLFRFNSTLVRLQGKRPLTYHEIIRKFQFHTGSITSAFSHSMLSVCYRFNSTLVRLQVNFGLHQSVIHTEVSIPHRFDYKVFLGRSLQPQKKSFNSTLVRLQVELL